MKDEFENKSQKPKRQIATKKQGQEIQKILGNMKLVPQHNFPKPAGMDSYSNVEDRYRQMLMRRQRHVERTLNQASNKMSQEWDRNS